MPITISNTMPGRTPTTGGANSAYLRGGPIATAAPAPLTGGARLISVLPSVLAAGASFIPGVGTAAAAGLGAIGEAARQNLSGENINLGRIGQEAALSAIPGGLGLLAKGAKAARAVNVTAKGLQVADAGAQAAGYGSRLGSALGDVNRAAQAASKTSAAGKATQSANALLASQYGALHTPVARANDLLGTVGRLADVGITKPQDAERVASGITGGNGILTKAVTKAAGGAGVVKTDGLQGIVNDAIQNHGLVGTEAKSVQSIVKGQLTKLTGGPNATISGNANPSDALGVMKSLESRIADLRGQGGNYKLTDPTRMDKASVLQTLHNEIQDRLYTAAGANSNLSKVLTPELRNSLVALHPTSPQWAKYVDGMIMQSKDVGALRSAAAPFVRISKIINDAAQNAGTAGGKLTNSLPGSGGLVKGAVNAVLGSAPVKRAAAGALRTAGGVATGPVGTTAAVVGKGAKALAAQGAVHALGGDFNNLAQTPQNTGPNALTSPSADQPTVSPTDVAGGSGAFSPAVLQAMALHDIQTTGGKNLAKIQALDSMFGPNAKTKSTLTAAQQQRGSDIQDALSYLDTAQQQLAELGGAQGPAGAAANIPVIGQFINPKAAAYDKTKIDIATAIAKALTGSKPAASVIRAYAESLPLVTDTPQVAAQKLANVRLELTNKGKAYGVGG